MDLREVQKPLKQRYTEDSEAARITLRAQASETDAPIRGSVGVGRAIQEAQAHIRVGGEGTAAWSGDMLLAALAACVPSSPARWSPTRWESRPIGSK